AKPSEREEWVYGIREASSKQRARFIATVVDALKSGKGPAFDRYIQDITMDKSLLVKVNWVVLVRDIKSTKPEILNRILICYLAYSLYLLQDDTNLCSDEALQLIKRDIHGWIQHFDGLEVKAMEQPDDWEIEVKDISLLCHLLRAPSSQRLASGWLSQHDPDFDTGSISRQRAAIALLNSPLLDGLNETQKMERAHTLGSMWASEEHPRPFLLRSAAQEITHDECLLRLLSLK
ncbi:hypothetical protein B0I35DRAFT_500413, partial [Stachybotrys elegans]